LILGTHIVIHIHYIRIMVYKDSFIMIFTLRNVDVDKVSIFYTWNSDKTNRFTISYCSLNTLHIIVYTFEQYTSWNLFIFSGFSNNCCTAI